MKVFFITMLILLSSAAMAEDVAISASVYKLPEGSGSSLEADTAVTAALLGKLKRYLVYKGSVITSDGNTTVVRQTEEVPAKGEDPPRDIGFTLEATTTIDPGKKVIDIEARVNIVEISGKQGKDNIYMSASAEFRRQLKDGARQIVALSKRGKNIYLTIARVKIQK